MTAWSDSRLPVRSSSFSVVFSARASPSTSADSWSKPFHARLIRCRRVFDYNVGQNQCRYYSIGVEQSGFFYGNNTIIATKIHISIVFILFSFATYLPVYGSRRRTWRPLATAVAPLSRIEFQLRSSVRIVSFVPTEKKTCTMLLKDRCHYDR